MHRCCLGLNGNVFCPDKMSVGGLGVTPLSSQATLLFFVLHLRWSTSVVTSCSHRWNDI